MTPRDALRGAVVAALKASAGLADAGVFDAPPVRAALPFALVEEPVLTDWSTKSWVGREARLTVSVQDGGERPIRLRALAGAAEAAVLALAGDLGGGWRLANVALTRSRMTRAGERWMATSEFQMRIYQP